DLSPRAVDALAGADVVACEDTRRTRALLTSAGISGRSLIAVHDHNEEAMAARVVELVGGGSRVALVTDAGTPGIADPGGRPVAVARELTKLHEEGWRGTLGGAAEHLAATEPRGEYVLVVGAAPPAGPATTADIESALKSHLQRGETKRDAVAAVAVELRAP